MADIEDLGNQDPRVERLYDKNSGGGGINGGGGEGEEK